MRRPLALLLALLASVAPVAARAQDLPVTASRKRAILVGCGAYRSLSPLQYPKADAEAVAEVLKARFSFDPAAVRVLTDGGKPEDAPTSANVLGAIDAALADPKRDRADLFVLYFSGHGIGTKSGDYLVPTDVSEAEVETKGIPLRRVVERFVKAGLKNVLVVCDACRAGDKNPFGSDLIRLGRSANLGLLLGCAPGGRSYEYDSLGHGAFTHYLLKALADPALADPATGAVFASSLGARVRKKVEGYTAADHGDSPQIPSVWAEKTQDALLAVYPPKETAAGIQALPVASDRARLVRYLSALGETLPYDAPGSLAGANALKALDALGEATDADLYRLIRRLRNLGRDAEMAPVSASLARRPEGSAFRDYGLIASHPEDVGRHVYRGALLRTVADPDVAAIAPTFLDVMMENRLGASDAERAAALATLLPVSPEGTRPGDWIRARRAGLLKAPEEALRLAAAGEALPGDNPGSDDFARVRYDALDALNRDAEAAAVAENALRSGSPGLRAYWRRRVLGRAVRMKSADRLVRLHEAAADAETPHDLVEIVMSAGDEAPALLPEAKAVAERFPYSWEARAAVWLCESVADFKPPRPFTEDELKYAPTPLDMMTFAYGKADVLLIGAQDAKRVNGYAARRHRERLAAYMIAERDLFARPYALQAFCRLVEGTPRAFESALRLKTAGAEALAGDGESASLARAAALYVHLSAGLLDDAKAMFATMRAKGESNPLAVTRLALGLALGGRGKEALEILDLADPATKATGVHTVVSALALTADGRKDEAKRLLESSEDVKLDRNGVIALRLAQTPFKTNGNTWLELVGVFADPPRGRLDLTAAALLAVEASFATVADDGRNEQRNALASFAADYPGNPLFQSFRFRAKGAPDRPDDFYGRYVLAGEVSIGSTSSSATLTLDVGPDGATGFLSDGGAPYPIAAKIDPAGNLFGTLKIDATEAVFLLKLPPGRIAAEIVKGSPLDAGVIFDAPVFAGFTATSATFVPPSGTSSAKAPPAKAPAGPAGRPAKKPPGRPAKPPRSRGGRNGRGLP